MPTHDWKIVRFQAGEFGICSRDKNGEIIYTPEPGANKVRKFADLDTARVECERLNRRPVVPPRLSEQGYIQATEHVNLTIDMRHALRRILVEGQTWKLAASAHGVTESGILRAMRRVAARNLFV